MRTGPQRARLPEDPGRKIIPSGRAAALFSRLRGKGRRIVFTNGCFDILHAGHARYLRQAAKLGDVLVVGLNGDGSVRRLKGEGRPVQCEADRAYLLASFSFVSYVVIFREDTPAALIERVLPDVLVKGGDWRGREIVGAELVRERGGSVRTIRFLSGRSTTAILSRIAARKCGPGRAAGFTGSSSRRRERGRSPSSS